MINTKSLTVAIRKACASLTEEGAFQFSEVYGLYQNPSRLPVAGTCAGNVISSSIPVVLGKRVNLTGFNVTSEQFMIPDGAGFRVAATLADALAGVSQPVADGNGTVFEESITAEDSLDVLKSFQVAFKDTSFLQNPPNTIEGDKNYLNINYCWLHGAINPDFSYGPIPNISHILCLICPSTQPPWWNPDLYPTLVYGLVASPVTSVPAGKRLKVGIRPYMRSL